MNYLLNTLTDGEFSPLADFFFDDDRSYSSSRVMKTDIKENEKEYLLEVELPGFDKKNLSVAYDNGYLTVTAKINNDGENKHHSFIRRERYMGTYERSFYVGEINKEQINASYDNGILSITLPKEDKELIENRRRIEIK